MRNRDDKLVERVLEQIDEGGEAPVDFAVQIFGVYVLQTLENFTLSAEQRKRLLRSFDLLWLRHSPALVSPVETNVQYRSQSANHYVRVPWQLYLVGLAALVRPYKAFATAPSQRYLEHVLVEVEGAGFTYPHSGKEVSARTAAVIVQILDKIRPQLKSKTVQLSAAVTVDSLLRWVGTPPFRYLASAFALFICGFALYQWRSGGGALEEAAPDLVASLLIFFLASGKGGT